ncbi:MAG: aldo/keto reductase [Dehalococcoidia bacterium]|nr:aldo/keto reductase [Dehalococcoidia bacterium]
MEYVRLGSSDLTVSRLALGAMTFGWTADREASFAIMDEYVAAGGNFIDTADIYSRWARGNGGGESERMIGAWLAERGVRGHIVIATKVRGRMWPGPAGEGLGREHIVKSCEASLKRLGVDTIDLYQCHWFDESVPFEETIRAFEELIAAGKVRSVGVSNFVPEQFRQALSIAGVLSLPAVVSLQPHYNLVHRAEFELELESQCLEHGVGVIPYSPLAKGFLTGRYSRTNIQAASRSGVRDYLSDSAWATLDAVVEIAAVRGVPVAAVALAWLLARPAVTAPILGARTVGQLREQLPAANLQLGEDEVARLTGVSNPSARG